MLSDIRMRRWIQLLPSVRTCGKLCHKKTRIYDKHHPRSSYIMDSNQWHYLLLALLLRNIVASLCQKRRMPDKIMCGCAMLMKFSNILCCFSDVLKGGRRRWDRKITQIFLPKVHHVHKFSQLVCQSQLIFIVWVDLSLFDESLIDPSQFGPKYNQASSTVHLLNKPAYMNKAIHWMVLCVEKMFTAFHLGCQKGNFLPALHVLLIYHLCWLLLQFFSLDKCSHRQTKNAVLDN